MFIIHQKDLKKKNEKEITRKYNFQGQSAILIRWFDLDQEWSEEKFSTHEPDFYKKIYQTNIRGQDMKIYQLFVVTIGNTKVKEK